MYIFCHNSSIQLNISVYFHIVTIYLPHILCFKKFRNCLKKLAIVDNTLEELEITMDYQKLSKQIIWIVLGWFAIVLLLSYSDYLRWQNMADNPLKSIYITFILNYCSHINIINDLIFASILGLVFYTYKNYHIEINLIIRT